MRLSKKEQNIIKDTMVSIFGEVTIYLFGSRMDISKKGGDIDLFVVSNNATFINKIKALSKLKMLLHKPVDIVLHKDFTREIEKEGLRGIKL